MRGALKLAGWFALAYLGYWAAMALDRVLAEGVVFPLLGLRVTEWSVTPFRVRLAHAWPDALPAPLAVFLAVPVMLELAYLVFLARWEARLRSGPFRILLHFAGLWAVLFLSTQGAVLAYRGNVRLSQFFVQISAVGPGHLIRRVALTAVVALVVLGFGAMCSRRLLGELRGSVLPATGWKGLALLLLAAPVLLILTASSGFVVRFFGMRAVLYLLVPATACLLLALLGLLSGGRLSAHARPGARLGAWGAASALCAAAAVYAGLQQAPRVQPWLVERHMHSFSSPHYEILYDPRGYSPEAVRTFAGERERILASEAARLASSVDPAVGFAELHFRVVLYPDLSAMRAATGSERLYSVDGTTIRAVLGGYVDRLDPAAEAAALLDATWGRPGSVRLGQWAARWLAGQWRGRPLDKWAGQIEREVGHYTLTQLVESSSDGLLSPLVRQPLGAAWVGTVFDRGGVEAVRKLYAARQAIASLSAQLGATPGQLEQAWQQWTAAAAGDATADPPPQRLPDPSFFFRGISFSHEGWAGRGGGYISPEAAAELRRLKALGANAIAVVPYGFAFGPHQENISYTETDESDEELTQALHAAHSLGLRVMLKPQLWAPRGGFTGTIRFDDPASRVAWMRNYREFILHYARLAELEQFDLLCIGTEFEGLTPYQDDWRRLIAEVRRVYRGPITYAANWGHEFESVGFWDALDYAAVNNYYPLRAAPRGEATGRTPLRAEDLLPAAQRLADKLEALSRKWHKPILFTEVGYPSVRGSSSEPWTEDARRGISLEEQAAAYEATFRAFAGRAWFRGMFWWKWPSSGRGGGPRDASYTPLGKPAEQVLRNWFTQLAATSPSSPPQKP